MDLSLSQKYFISLLKIIIAKFTHHQSNLKLLKLKESFQLKSRPTLPNWIYYCCACIAFQELRRIQMGKLRLAEEKEKKNPTCSLQMKHKLQDNWDHQSPPENEKQVNHAVGNEKGGKARDRRSILCNCCIPL